MQRKRLTILICMMLVLLPAVFVFAEKEPTISEQMQQVKAVYEQGIAFYKQGRYQQAVKAFDATLEMGGNRAPIYYNLANAWYRLENTGRAIVYYRKVIDIAPEFIQAYYNLGKLYYQLGEYGDAIVTFKEALTIQEEHVQLYLLLGDCYRKVEAYGEAVYVYEQARELTPFDSVPYFSLAQVYVKIGDYAKAVTILKEAAGLVKDPERIYQYLGELHYSLGHYAEAVSPLERALLEKKERYLYHKLADVYLRLKRPYLAMDTLRQAIKAFPDFHDAVFMLASIYQEKGFYAKAEAQLLGLAEKDYRKARSHLYNLAVHYYNKKDFSALGKLCRRVLAIRATDPDFRELLREAREAGEVKNRADL